MSTKTNVFGNPLPGIIETSGWEGAWKQGVTPWEAQRPAPLIAELLKDTSLPAGDVIVVGCGSGHDAAEFARLGRKTLGVDLAPTAIAKCEALVEADPSLRALAAQGQLGFKQADLFNFNTPPYAVAWDYTLVSALPPALRPTWANALKRLVRPGGELVVLIFPVGDYEGGPPYAMNPTALDELLQQHGWEKVHLAPVPKEHSHKARAGREWLGRWRLDGTRHPAINVDSSRDSSKKMK